MIKYYKNLVLSNGWIMSCDNIRVNFVLNVRQAQDIITEFFNSIARNDIYNYPVNLTFARYKHLCTVTYGDDSVCTIAFGFNGASKIDQKGYDNDLKGYMDFNPNKVCSYDRFWADLGIIRSCCELFEIARSDIALDIPIPREYVLLKKDTRVYASKVYSRSNKTEYLGLRNNLGRVKVYNKQLESKLDVPMTRLEITCELSAESYFKYLPDVYLLNTPEQLGIDSLELTENDLAIIEIENELLMYGLDDGMIHWNSFSFRKRKKLTPFLVSESSSVGLAVSCEFLQIDAFLFDIKGAFL